MSSVIFNRKNHNNYLKSSPKKKDDISTQNGGIC